MRMRHRNAVDTEIESDKASRGQRERRKGSRFTDRQHVAIVNPRRRIICELVDISEHGAKLKLFDGAVPVEGEPVSLTLFDGTSVPSTVGWIRHELVGLRFLKPITRVEAHLIIEELGSDFYRKAIQLQKRVVKR